MNKPKIRLSALFLSTVLMLAITFPGIAGGFYKLGTPRLEGTASKKGNKWWGQVSDIHLLESAPDHLKIRVVTPDKGNGQGVFSYLVQWSVPERIDPDTIIPMWIESVILEVRNKPQGLSGEVVHLGAPPSPNFNHVLDASIPRFGKPGQKVRANNEEILVSEGLKEFTISVYVCPESAGSLNWVFPYKWVAGHAQTTPGNPASNESQESLWDYIYDSTLDGKVIACEAPHEVSMSPVAKNGAFTARYTSGKWGTYSGRRSGNKVHLDYRDPTHGSYTAAFDGVYLDANTIQGTFSDSEGGKYEFRWTRKK